MCCPSLQVSMYATYNQIGKSVGQNHFMQFKKNEEELEKAVENKKEEATAAAGTEVAAG